MTHLVINDLEQSQELDRAAMSRVYGGVGLLDLLNLVADVDNNQLFGLSTVASNSSTIDAFQFASNGNGINMPLQLILVNQNADADASDIGNSDTTVGTP